MVHPWPDWRCRLKPGKPLEDGQKLMDVWLLRLNHEKVIQVAHIKDLLCQPLVPFMTLPVKSPAVTKDTRVLVNDLCMS